MRYIIKDNECGNFCDWSYEKPPTEAEIIEHFISLNADEADMHAFEPYPHEAFSLGMISEIWNVDIIPVSEHIKTLEADLKDLGSNYMSGMYQSIIDELNTMRGALNE